MRREDPGRQTRPAVLGLIGWVSTAALVLLGVLGRNPAAVLLGQVIWASLLGDRGRPFWSRIPGAALALVFGYLLVGELFWLLSLAHSVDMASWAPVVGVAASVGLGAVSLLRVVGSRAFGFGATEQDAAGRPARAWVADVVLLCCFVVVAIPALRPGRLLGVVQFAVPGWEHMHNLARAALVDRDGHIDYGVLSPARNAQGDYYPRGFHLVFTLLARSARLAPDADLQAWMVGYVRTYWLVWAFVAVASATGAYRAVRMVRRDDGVAALAGLVAMLVVFVPPVLHRIVVPGFSSFALGVFAIVTAIAVYLERRWSFANLVLLVMALSVASHGWLVLAPVAVGAAVVLVLRLVLPPDPLGVRRPSRSAFLRGMVFLTVILLVGARPWIFTLASGDANAQAQENGAIEAAPNVVVLACGVGLAMFLAHLRRPRVIAWAAVPAMVLSVVFAIGLRAAAWHADYYYPKKVVWGALLLLLPMAAAGVMATAALVADRLPRAWRTSARVGIAASTTVVLSAALHGTATQVLLNRPFLNSASVSAAERAIDFRRTSQLVIWGVGSPNDDRLASLWGRAARDVRRDPALDVSNIDFAATDRAGLCTAASEVGVRIELLVGTAAGRPVNCP